MKVIPLWVKLDAVSVRLQYLLLGPWLLLHSGELAAENLPDFSRKFSTSKYTIEMRVSFPAPYEGTRLAVYRSADPQKENCLSVERGASGCTEKFVGALAFVAFAVNRVTHCKSEAASIREVVTLLDQSPGMPDRPPFTMSVRLVNGVGSDVQVFGYDESPLPPVKRAAEREVAKAAWRRYRQELYMDKDRQPFAVVEWLHTTTRICVLRVDAPASFEARIGVRSALSSTGPTRAKCGKLAGSTAKYAGVLPVPAT